MGALVKPELVLKKDVVFGRVETSGEITRGSIFFNKCSFVTDGKGQQNTEIIIDLDHQGYIDLLADAIKH